MKNTKKQPWWLLLLVAGFIPLTIILGNIYNIPDRIIILVVVVAALIFGSMAIWLRANLNANGDEWWQDDSASGWRGY